MASEEFTYATPTATGTFNEDDCTGFSQVPLESFGPQVVVLVGAEPRGIRSGSG